METSPRSRAAVDAALTLFADQGQYAADALGEDYRRLWTALREAAGAGKRVRSTLFLAAHHAYGGRDDEVAVKAAAALELLHTGFVIHDDVIDRDLRRHGTLNVAGTFLERARGQGVADDGCAVLGLTAGVLAGDLALVAATTELALCGAEPDVTRRLLDQLSDAVRISAAGELDDVVWSIRARVDASLGEVITLAERKTAVYSFQLPLQAGAVLAGAPEADVEALGPIGRLAGIGFQLVDDLRGVFADDSTTGKDSLGDLREGKVTALITHARSTDAWPRLAPYVGDPDLDPDRAATARRLLEECGSRAYVEQLADSYLSAAVEAAERADLAPALQGALADLCRRILSSAA